jgi:hypothetical protein
MNLFETLKQFKNIEPDSAYKEKSKRMVLATERVAVAPRRGLSFGRSIAAILETGIAVALSVFFILVVSGRVTNAPYLSPAQFSVINPDTLQAEAQAIDIQIELAQVAYTIGSSTAESTPQVTAALLAKKPSLLMAPAASPQMSSTTDAASSTASSSLSVDDALRALLK